MKNGNKFLLFMLGLGSQTQFHFLGSIGISEFPVFLVAPFIFVRDYRLLKRDGFLPAVWLALLMAVFSCVGGYINETPMILVLKGSATVYAIFAMLVVFHRLLRNNFNNIKYLFVGIFISSIVSIFYFQQETYIASGTGIATGAEAIEAVTGYSLFWSTKFSQLVELPIDCFYMRMPLLYSILAPLASCIVFILCSESSGRSAAVVSAGAVLIIALCGKSRVKMRRLGRNIVLFIMLMLVLLAVFKAGYKYMATRGMLGEGAQAKYERQTRMGSSILRLLIAGRSEFFIGMRAALDKPIIGHGPKPRDTGGYVAKFLLEYGSQEDYEGYLRHLKMLRRFGIYDEPIPCHSCIATGWLTCGIVGLIFWLYVLGKYFLYFKCYSHGIPQWFGYISIAICHAAWNIFFSGIHRIEDPLCLTCVLFAAAVAKGRLQLPAEMEIEARKCE